MMLWDIIRDWFVMNIFGGKSTIGGFYGGLLGDIVIGQNGDFVDLNTYNNNELLLPIGNVESESYGSLIGQGYISLADWLSTTATIIVLIALCFFFFLMVRWLFRLTAGLIQGRG